MSPLTGSWDEPHQAAWQQDGLNDHFFIKADLAGRSSWQIFPQPSSNCWTATIFMSLRISTPVVRDFMLLMAHFMPSSRKGRCAAFPGWTWTHLFVSGPTLSRGCGRRGRKHAAHSSRLGFLLRLLRARDRACWVLNWWNWKNTIPMK